MPLHCADLWAPGKDLIVAEGRSELFYYEEMRVSRNSFRRRAPYFLLSRLSSLSSELVCVAGAT